MREKSWLACRKEGRKGGREERKEVGLLEPRIAGRNGGKEGEREGWLEVKVLSSRH